MKRQVFFLVPWRFRWSKSEYTIENDVKVVLRFCSSFWLWLFPSNKNKCFFIMSTSSIQPPLVRFSNNPIHHPSIFAGGFPGSKPNCDPPVVVAKGVTVPRLTNPLSTERHWEKKSGDELKWIQNENISSSKPSHTNIKRQRQVLKTVLKTLQKLALTRGVSFFQPVVQVFHVFLLGGGFIATLQLTKRLPVDDCWKYKHIPPKLQFEKTSNLKCSKKPSMWRCCCKSPTPSTCSRKENSTGNRSLSSLGPVLWKLASDDSWIQIWLKLARWV